MKYKLLCIDIDGTLLNDNKQLLPKVKESVRNVSEKGIQVALVSGRMPAGVEIIEKKLGIECIKICNAGTYILKGSSCISAAYVSNDDMRSIYHRYAQTRKMPLWIFEERDWYVTDVDKFVRWEMSIVPYKPQVVDLEELAEKWEEEGKKPNKLLVASDVKQIQEIHQKMRQDIEDGIFRNIAMARSADTFIEIFPGGVNKGSALRSVCRELGIRVEETIAIGDQELDIPMIEAAGVGIAMGNAIPELKAKADFVTKTNNEAGIAYALEQYL